MDLPIDEKFLDVASDVVVRFKGHGSYKGEIGAIKAFKKRAPGHKQKEYESTFKMFCQIYDKAVDLVYECAVKPKKKKSKYAEYEDIDFDYCMKGLELIQPGYATGEKAGILNWVIFWHYLK